jgi:hypothetical protein
MFGRSKPMKKIRIGDIIEIKTTKGIAYAIYTHRHVDRPRYGPLIHIFDHLYESRPDCLADILKNSVLFATFFPLGAAVNRGLVEVVGNITVPPELSEFPVFRSGIPDQNPQNPRIVKVWWLWDGKNEWRVGDLTPVQRTYPLRGIWNFSLLIERIEKRWRAEDDPIWGGVRK